MDPARHPFDAASAEQVVRSLGPARCVPRRPDVAFSDPVMSLALDGVSLLRRIAFRADEPGDPLVLASYIDTHLAEARRRAAAPA
ncbi:hypothetical protein RFN58_41020 [Streptomyces iakyrus]|uniref:hypothetical protein n=1 Tax=Streptomyces iakyrus TaxID=68219 RepID=UPI000526FE38|nr:hypothetical protein [Streptomyces iakyrus]